MMSNPFPKNVAAVAADNDEIARAILSERRRCCLIARKWKASSFQDEAYAANSIADQIMDGDA